LHNFRMTLRPVEPERPGPRAYMPTDENVGPPGAAGVSDRDQNMMIIRYSAATTFSGETQGSTRKASLPIMLTRRSGACSSSLSLFLRTANCQTVSSPCLPSARPIAEPCCACCRVYPKHIVHWLLRRLADGEISSGSARNLDSLAVRR
jgi:hypothetical protein